MTVYMVDTFITSAHTLMMVLPGRHAAALIHMTHMARTTSTRLSPWLVVQVWNVQYRAPQFGRKRCPDLQITGPSLRDGGRPGSARMGGYTPAADDATSYVSSSYATGYYK